MKNLLITLLLLTISTLSISASITVGTDICDETSIQTAINIAKFDPNIDEIRVATNGIYNENIIIGNQSIIIRGGYVDCASAVIENPPSRSGQTTITGVVNAGSPVIRITGDSEQHSIVLDSLSITGGTVNLASDYTGGGISAFNSWSNIEIINSNISGNTGAAGGGLAIFEGAGFTLVNITDTLIFSNSAALGGGVLCSGTESSIRMQGASGVSLNNATIGQGGGLYMTEGCDFTSYSGTDGTGGGFNIQGILGNTAVGNGGGIYAKLASQITLYGHQNCAVQPCIGNNTSPASLTSNHSDIDGGGVYLTGFNTALKIYAGLVNGNTASGDGGAIYVDNSALFLTERLSSECWSQDHCNHYVNNQAGVANGNGGMVYSQLGTINISHSVIENNRADIGTVIAAINSPAISTIKSSIIYNNGNNGADGFNDIYVFSIASGAKIDVSHSTIADNKTNIAVFNISSTSIGDSDLFASIVDGDINTPVFASNQSNNVYVNCMMLHEVASIPNTQLSTTVNDAEFIDRANGDYHLDPLLSPAIDYCDDFAGPSNYKDIDFESYGVNYPSVGVALFDLGADEVYPTYALTVGVTGNGSVTSNPQGIDCGIDCSEDYLIDTMVTLTATPLVGNSFDSWTGVCAGSSQTCVVTMDQAQDTTAMFTPNFYLLSVTVTGNGTVTSSPVGIDCGVDCIQAYTPNTSVTLTATADSGYVFVEWSGDCSGSGSCVLNMGSGKSARALFEPEPTYTLAITVSGNGTITSNPLGINCGVDCSESYANNTSVTLTATPMSGFNFVDWSGDCTGTGSCVFSMSQNRNVRANFTANEYTLTTNVIGSGSISSNPAGINCESDCTQDYTNNTSVTLTATPLAGFNFAGWSGDCSGTGSCVVSMTQDRNVTATFSAIEFTLTTAVIGSGSISSNPAGINCESDCTQDYTNNTSVTLTATPITGFEFVSWSGDCSGNTSCVVSMTQNRNVIATFSETTPDDLVFKNGFE